MDWAGAEDPPCGDPNSPANPGAGYYLKVSVEASWVVIVSAPAVIE